MQTPIAEVENMTNLVSLLECKHLVIVNCAFGSIVNKQSIR
jgi:hypothetical protein